MRKVTVLVLLASVVEGAWLLGGLDLLRQKATSGVVGQVAREVGQVKQIMEQAREAMALVTPPVASDRTRDPFALPSGVHLLGQAPDGEGEGAGGAPSDKTVVAALPEPPARELGGILVGPRGRLAIIDGAIVRAGDTLDGEHVADIRRDHVVLTREGGSRTLRLSLPFQ